MDKKQGKRWTKSVSRNEASFYATICKVKDQAEVIFTLTVSFYPTYTKFHQFCLVPAIE